MVATLTTTTQLFKRQAHKMVKHSQTSRRIGLLLFSGGGGGEGQKMKTLDRSGLKIRIYNEIFINETLRDLVLFIQFKNMKNAHGGKLLLVKLH